MTLWMRILFTPPNICVTLKVQLLLLKSDFITLKSSGGLAALLIVHVSCRCEVTFQVLCLSWRKGVCIIVSPVLTWAGMFVQVAQALLDKGVPVNTVDSQGCTPVQYCAIFHQPVPLARLLIGEWTQVGNKTPGQSSSPDNTQLQVYYMQICFDADMRPLCIHIFSDQDSCQQVGRQSKTAKPCLPDRIPIHCADWFKGPLWKFYSKAYWLKIHFFSWLSLHVC